MSTEINTKVIVERVFDVKTQKWREDAWLAHWNCQTEPHLMACGRDPLEALDLFQKLHEMSLSRWECALEPTRLTLLRPCPECGGSGGYECQESEPCRSCGGSGIA